MRGLFAASFKIFLSDPFLSVCRVRVWQSLSVPVCVCLSDSGCSPSVLPQLPFLNIVPVICPNFSPIPHSMNDFHFLYHFQLLLPYFSNQIVSSHILLVSGRLPSLTLASFVTNPRVISFLIGKVFERKLVETLTALGNDKRKPYFFFHSSIPNRCIGDDGESYSP